ncbi:hypothetical protein MUCCIDRAFT_40510 [Mucor lusitanicus CBS 277.49]|uniref:Mitochondrial distribution and morphology protein 12 n=1 Tax=Mucor lusitanicus CBS 277.49 TaxID=747725 RepID=A0A168KB91_MUCCL|nr:hypothetical protein MUCCIDRAFT_40510 [Mucor lusitanicus CBS 277.49]
MSLDIDWQKLDSELAGHVQQFLNKHFQAITKPSFIGDIQVKDFQWGNEAPQIEITNITEPFPEFYEQEDVDEQDTNAAKAASEDWIDDEDINRVSDHPSSIPPASNATINNTPSTEMDFQVHMLISYKGDMSMTVITELRMNYPSVMFMSLPINLKVRSVEFEATAVVAYIQSMQRVCVSMLEPEDTRAGGAGSKDIGMDRDVHIETVVGDEQKQVLKNVGKIEKFIVDQLRKMLDDELVFPSYQLIQLQ